jgi:RNA-binding protein Nova
MLGPWAFEAQAVVTEHVLAGLLARYRHGALDEVGSQVVLMKICVSNALAGSIIGRGGHNRDQLQLISGGARIQLSRPNELYPGTSDRVLIIMGNLGSCITALFAISGCLGMPGPLPLEAVFMGVSSQWKLVLPSSVCGYILGSGGRTVRAITAQADANISISAEPDRNADLPRERIATISGGCLQTLRALGLIVDRVRALSYDI